MTPTELQFRIAATADYLSAYWALPAITAKTVVLNAYGTIASRGVQITWNESQLSLGLTLVITPGVVDENHGYAAFLAAPLHSEINRLKSIASDEASFSTKKRAMQSEISTLTPEHPNYKAAFITYTEFVEAAYPELVLSVPPEKNHWTPLGTALVVDDSGEALRRVFADESHTLVSLLGKGNEPEKNLSVSYGAILEAPPERFSKILASIYSPFWRPIVLPGASWYTGNRHHALERSKIATLWGEVVAEALAVRRSRDRRLTISPVGFETVGRVVQSAAIKTKAAKHRGKFLWVAQTTVKLAATHHLIQGHENNEIPSSVWDAAEVQMQALIEAHAEATDIAKPRIEKSKAIQGRPGDLRIFYQYLEDHPQARLRDVCRALPKRRPGYWRTFANELKGIPQKSQQR